MSIHDRNARKLFHEASSENRTRSTASRFGGGASYEIFRDGVFCSVVNGIEAFARNTVLALSNLQPEHRWDYAPVSRPDGYRK